MYVFCRLFDRQVVFYEDAGRERLLNDLLSQVKYYPVSCPCYLPHGLIVALKVVTGSGN